MPTPIQPDKFARAAGYDPTDFVKAVQNGEDDFAGLPIGSWRQNGGEYLNVPDDYAEQLGFDPANGRSNPTKMRGQKIAQIAENTDNPNWPEAVKEAAPPVSANAGAAYTAGQFADTVKEQPQVMEDLVDGAALFGSAGLAYATAEEGEVLKAGATAAGLFAAFKGIRYLCEQGNRQTDMQERHQRHQLQQQNRRQVGQPQNRMKPKTPDQRRLSGKQKQPSSTERGSGYTADTNSGIRVGGA
jgi:hypothetical protein